MQRRLAYLDLLRVISVALVMYGHFVLVAGGKRDLAGIVAPEVTLPLIDETQWRAYLFEIFLIERFSTQGGVLGVSLFFLITGYLMPLMCDRYGRAHFLLNRAFRIFPALIAALALIGTFLGVTQGLHFSLQQYLASGSLSFGYAGVLPVTGVLWTLVVEMHFYLIAFLIGRFDARKLLIVQAVMLALVLAGALVPGHYYLHMTAMNARYMLLIMIGSAIYLAEKEGWGVKTVMTVLPSVVFSLVGFQLFKLAQVDPGAYGSVGNHLLALGVFVAFMLLATRVVIRLPGVITILADMVYPIYLLHVAIGLSAIAVLRQRIDDPYALLACAVLLSLVLSWIVHRLIEQPGIEYGRRVSSRIVAWGGRLRAARRTAPTQA